MAEVTLLVGLGKANIGAAVLLSCVGLLRVGEALQLRMVDVIESPAHNVTVLLLPRTIHHEDAQN